ncbi:MAG: carboxylating nicotinate-nucleotide diphosphorylase [Bacteroidota bacterium]
MQLSYLTDDTIRQFIENAFREDVGDGDHSTLASVPKTAAKSAKVFFKDKGIAAGMEMAKFIFNQFDPRVKLDFKINDGDEVKYGDLGIAIHGPAQSILTCERLVLNCMQRMSGIATYTNKLTELVSGTKAKLLDTRKTTPNFRIAEKWAVAIGGGTNHRYGLYDMVMLKDNHIDFAGSIAQAVASTKKYLREVGKKLRIEIETRNLNEVREALEAEVDVIMLDNMDINTMKEAVRIIGDLCETEASGGITEETIQSVAECGVDFISVGALTHSIKSLDISLKAVK